MRGASSQPISAFGGALDFEERPIGWSGRWPLYARDTIYRSGYQKRRRSELFAALRALRQIQKPKGPAALPLAPALGRGQRQVAEAQLVSNGKNPYPQSDCVKLAPQNRHNRSLCLFIIATTILR